MSYSASNLKRLFIDTKSFLSDEINRINFVSVIIILGIFYMFYNIKTEITQQNDEIINRIEKTERKVDFRYFNTVKTLEEIHNIEINTKNGKIIRHRVSGQ